MEALMEEMLQGLWEIIRQMLSRGITMKFIRRLMIIGHFTNQQEELLVEGILVLDNEELRRRMDIRIFIDADADERFIRRFQRDIRNRDRSMESIIDQYQKTVRPMHLRFIEPSKRYADLIIPEGAHNEVAIDLLVTKIQDIMKYGVMVTPALVIDGEVMAVGKVLAVDEIKVLLV